MIGVACAPSERLVVREFFELFKTPWAFDDGEAEYEVVIVTAAAGDVRRAAAVTVAVGSTSMPIDERIGVTVDARPPSGQVIEYTDASVPLLGAVATFSGSAVAVTRLADGRPAAVKVHTAGGTFIRCGFDLFTEVERLLSEGQNSQHGSSPTLDAYIELLRGWIVNEVDVLVEIPPVREGHPYAVCLTHDVDFLALRTHRCDRTLLGFLYRATIGSLRDVVTGRGDVRRLARNWLTVVSLPLFYLGVRRDPWQPFSSYVAADGARSTFFVIPYRGRGGEGLEPKQARARQVSYDVEDVGQAVRELHSDGYEIAVHGIDAWRSTASGRAELQRFSSVNTHGLGVRMHWLLSDAESYRRLDAAGYDYDATCGYNDAIGFRAGTTQVFKPLDADHLLELPLHIQDTALFFPGRLHLSEREAWEATEEVRRKALGGGGVLTVSWHDRSLAPERLWDRFYSRLLRALRSDGAWFGTAGDVVAWFRLRRGVKLDTVDIGPSAVVVNVYSPESSAARAGFVIRVHTANGGETKTVDVPWRGEQRLEVPLASAAELEAPVR